MEMARNDHISEYKNSHLLFEQQQQQVNDSVPANFLMDEAILTVVDNSNHKSEYSIPLLPFQQQHFCFDTIVESFLPSEMLIDERILMGCNSSAFIHTDKRLSNLMDVVIPEVTPRKEMLEKFGSMEEEQHPAQISLEKATKEDQYSHELKIPISSIKDEVENHLEYLLSRLLIGKCTVEKACEIAMQKVVKHFSSELLKWLDEILFLDLMSHEQLRQLGCYEFYHINSGIVIANEQYFEIFSELRMNHKKLEAVVLDSFSIKSTYGKNSEEADVVFCLILEAIRELPDSIVNHLVLDPTIFSDEPPICSGIPRYPVQFSVPFGINDIGTGHPEMARDFLCAKWLS
ncbi:hypothetical protein A4A49_11335 [Nicotiana attenuata]|uniref:Uncharacterized protein n=1 Tax=Nicotiana attenuata TaxID=49451 RepID=A0A1J6I3E8_NICAT|nr:hypothetical protein A4A49_11335 [Nicotiana attenuata]